ncbi:MAG: hypothetical protein NTX61_00925 [Bacteroidetes bacterium]|nr:hypothetical protein [Bacteroidota bacterium]
MRRRIVIFFFSVIMAFSGKGQIMGWEPLGLTGYGPSPWPITFADLNLAVGGLTRGPGVTTTGSAAANGWGGTGFFYATASAGIAANAFVTFTIEANNGYLVSLSALDLNYRRSASGPPSGLLQYQVDNGAFYDICTLTFPSSTGSGGSIPQVILTTFVALQNVHHGTLITIRIIPYGASSSLGTWYVYNVTNPAGYDLKMNGTVTSDNSPVTYTWVGNDGGNWTTPANWNPTRQVPADNDILLFNYGFSKTIQMVPGETVGQVIISANTIVNLIASGSNTLTIIGGVGDDFIVPSGSQLLVSGANPLAVSCSPGITSVITGILSINGNLIIGTGSSFKVNPGSSVTVEGNIVINGGTNQFGEKSAETMHDYCNY